MRLVRSMSLAAVLVIAVSCSGDDSGSDPADDTAATTVGSTASEVTTTVTASTTTSTASTTTGVPTTVAPTSTATGPTSSGAPTTTEACEAPTEAVDVVENFPGTLSSLYGDDVDTGGHPCFERVVFNFAGEGERPGFSVKYVADPVVLASSGEPTELRGEANLIVSVGTWMGEEGNFDGEPQMFPTNVSSIEEVILIDNFEGVMIWGIGLDEERPFEVFVLQDPFRLVVDIATPPAG